MGLPPVSTSSELVRHIIDGLLSLASPDLTSRDIVPTFPATLTTIALNDSTLRWFEACTRMPASRGLPSSPVQLHTSFSGDVFVTHDPFLTFGRGHCWSVSGAIGHPREPLEPSGPAHMVRPQTNADQPRRGSPTSGGTPFLVLGLRHWRA